jgi:hypothetical protein
MFLLHVSTSTRYHRGGLPIHEGLGMALYIPRSDDDLVEVETCRRNVSDNNYLLLICNLLYQILYELNSICQSLIQFNCR